MIHKTKLKKIYFLIVVILSDIYFIKTKKLSTELACSQEKFKLIELSEKQIDLTNRQKTSIQSKLPDLKTIYSIENIINKLGDNNTQFILFTFTDILGNLHEAIVPIDQAHSALKNGITFDGSSIPGYSLIESSDMVIKPDLTTLRFLPWTGKANSNMTAWFICNTYNSFEEPNETDARYILEKASQELEQLGYRFLVGPELEFFIFKKEKQKVKLPIDYIGYFEQELSIERQQENTVILNGLKELEIDIEKLHHEVAPGQHELSIKYGSALNIADQLVVTKYALKILFSHFGKHVSFMPKPFKNQNGSGMHLNYSLWDVINEKNGFYDKHKDYNLSETAQHFIAGNIAHIKNLSLIFNPSVNSYKRLVPEYEAPIYICWGKNNRSALFRLPLIPEDQPESLRMELRGPDGTSNPYLAIAALIQSGIDGIKSNLELQKPINKNVFRNCIQNYEQDIQSLPKNLGMAIKSFTDSDIANSLLTQVGKLEFIKLKQAEWKDFRLSITNWETNKYL